MTKGMKKWEMWGMLITFVTYEEIAFLAEMTFNWVDLANIKQVGKIQLTYCSSNSKR